MPKFILLVDDDAASLALMQHVLTRAGHLVIAAQSGIGARQALEAARFDLVVTDIFMPDMDGLELIRHICATRPDMPVIAISGGPGAASQNFLPIASALGADMVLPKPLSPATLRFAVQEVAIDPAKTARCTALAQPGQA